MCVFYSTYRPKETKHGCTENAERELLGADVTSEDVRECIDDGEEETNEALRLALLTSQLVDVVEEEEMDTSDVKITAASAVRLYPKEPDCPIVMYKPPKEK